MPTPQRHRRARTSPPGVATRRLAAFSVLPAPLFTTAEALDAGLTQADLRSGDVVTVRHGVHVRSGLPVTREVRIAAALKAQPHVEARVSHLTAAAVLGLPSPASDRIHLSYPRLPRHQLHDTVAHRHAAGTHTVERMLTGLGRVRLTDPVGVVLECADALSLVDLVVLADAVLTRRDIAADVAMHTWRHATGRHASRVGEAAQHANPGAESPMESRLRLLLVLAGLPMPVAQHEVIVEGRRRRFDLAYPEYGVAIEYDGSHHYASEAQKQADILREEEVRATGWIIVRVVSHGIFRDPASTVHRVAEALGRRGLLLDLTDEWRLHFPQLT